MPRNQRPSPASVGELDPSVLRILQLCGFKPDALYPGRFLRLVIGSGKAELAEEDAPEERIFAITVGPANSDGGARVSINGEDQLASWFPIDQGRPSTGHPTVDRWLDRSLLLGGLLGSPEAGSHDWRRIIQVLWELMRAQGRRICSRHGLRSQALGYFIMMDPPIDAAEKDRVYELLHQIRGDLLAIPAPAKTSGIATKLTVKEQALYDATRFDWESGKVIAARAHYAWDSDTQKLLTSLRKRSLIEGKTGPGGGYRRPRIPQPEKKSSAP